MKQFILFIFTLCVVGCIDMTVDVPNACVSNSLGTVPASPVLGVAVPPITFSATKDFSDIFSKANDVTNGVTATVTQLTIDSTGDLQWITEVDVSVQGSNPDLPSAPFAQYMANGSDPGNHLSMQVQMDSDTVLKYMSQPVTLTFTISGMASDHSDDLSNTTCLELTGSFSKSL